jgi:hypothetical protein
MNAKIVCSWLLFIWSIWACQLRALAIGITGADVGGLRDIPSYTHVVERDRDTCVTEIVQTSSAQHGMVTAITNHYTTVAVGMNVQQPDGTFLPASTEIEVQEDGSGIAKKTRHKLVLRADILDGNGLIDFTGPAPDNIRFVTRPLCISYWDRATGKSVLIGEFKRTIGKIAPGGNKIVYEDCCADFKCNLIVQNTLAGVESWLEILEPPAPPSQYGLNNNSTRLELITEFLKAPQLQ